MKAGRLYRLAVAALAVTHAAVLVGCAQQPRKPAQTAPSIHAAAPSARVTQIGFGSDAYFAVCSGAACAAVTPKTLATVPDPLLPQPEPTPAPRITQPVAMTAVVNFATNSAELDAGARKILDRVVPNLNGDVVVQVEGRTDNVGPEKYNTTLARRRALAVKAYLVQAAPEMADRIQVDGRGACCYVAPNKSGAGRAKNRRADVKVTPPAPPRPRAATPS